MRVRDLSIFEAMMVAGVTALLPNFATAQISDAEFEASRFRCSLTCTDRCEYGRETGQVIVIKNGLNSALVFGHERVWPGAPLPDEVAAPYDWTGPAHAVETVDVFLDERTGGMMYSTRVVDPNQAAAILRVGPNAPNYSARLEFLQEKTFFRRREIVVSYSGRCERLS